MKHLNNQICVSSHPQIPAARRILCGVRMDNIKLNEFIRQINKVIPLIEAEFNTSHKPMFELILKRFMKAKEVVDNTEPENLKESMFKISGGVRAYLDASSDYTNPILNEMDKAEVLLDELFDLMRN